MKSKILSVLILIGVVISYIYPFENGFYIMDTPSKDEDIAIEWINSFMSMDFHSCDKLVLDDYNKIYSDEVKSLIKDENYYDAVMRNAVSCIKDISLISKEKGLTGEVYSFKVLFVPYDYATTLNINTEKVLALRDKYIDTEMSDADLKQELSILYKEVFMTTVFKQSFIEDSIVLRLIVDENKSISGVDTFIYNFLTAINIIDNIKFFNSNIKEDLGYLLR